MPVNLWGDLAVQYPGNGGRMLAMEGYGHFLACQIIAFYTAIPGQLCACYGLGPWCRCLTKGGRLLWCVGVREASEFDRVIGAILLILMI